MTRITHARLAGITMLVYFVAGISSLVFKEAHHVPDVLEIVTSFSALVLGVTFYAMTRVHGPDLALLGLMCRMIEAIPGTPGTIYFAVGSTAFCWLLLRGRMIPAGLAWLGVVASPLLALILLLQRAGFFANAENWSSSVTWLVWLPMFVFELSLAVWLLTKGVAAPVQTPVSRGVSPFPA